MEPFVTSTEIAVHLRTTRRHVLELTRQGVLPAHPLCFGSRRNSWRYKLSEVDEAIASRLKRPAGVEPVSTTPSDHIMITGSPRSRKGKF